MAIFTYTRTEKQGNGPEIVMTDGFEMNRIIKFIEYQPKQALVILDDWHEDIVPTPTVKKVNGRQQSVTEYKKMNICSQILLSEEDTMRFMAAIK